MSDERPEIEPEEKPRLPYEIHDHYQDEVLLPATPDARYSWRELVSQELAKQAEVLKKGAYTVDIPGISDIIILHRDGIHDRRRKAAKLARYLTRKSPLPVYGQEIVPIMTMIDDTQDCLALLTLTASLTPLGRIGWVAKILRATSWTSYAMNVVNDLLRTAIGGGMSKHLTAQELKRLGAVRKYRYVGKPNMSKTKLAVTLGLLAGQVSESLFGVGLRLGPLFGALTDANWGLARAIEGQPVVIRTPSNRIIDLTAIVQDTIHHPIFRYSYAGRLLQFSYASRKYLAKLYRAGRRLWQRWNTLLMRGVTPEYTLPYMDPEDQLMTAVGLNAAVATLARSDLDTIATVGIDGLAQQPLPRYVPGNPATKAALDEHQARIRPGFAPDLCPGRTSPTFQDVATPPSDTSEPLLVRLYTHMHEDDTSYAAWLHLVEFNSRVIDMITGQEDSLQPEFDDYQQAALQAIDKNAMPPPDAKHDEITRYINTALYLARRDGKKYPDDTHYDQAHTLIFGTPPRNTAYRPGEGRHTRYPLVTPSPGTTRRDRTPIYRRPPSPRPIVLRPTWRPTPKSGRP